MNEADITELMRLTFMLIFKLSGPLLAVALALGLLVAMLQAVTQINEATLVFIPKLLGIGATLLLLGVSMFGSLADFTHLMIDRMMGSREVSRRRLRKENKRRFEKEDVVPGYVSKE